MKETWYFSKLKASILFSLVFGVFLQGISVDALAWFRFFLSPFVNDESFFDIEIPTNPTQVARLISCESLQLLCD